ncbi:DUF1501 domain-containing protein [Tuwongella immobilis]|uniref:DUF1501 domain-containing protein n=1 Tax=Tuwongella immobilis TaxID=692036 RepID=A0A6C2YKF5_9BACT|nr:DUF1501 domain-containing protein [Tuwongella immobilis]VIP01402.1 protein containing duf1501 : Uncharacterized protein OS=Pirellula staleyi (strain ATCC 27377 / DSM 6068 / ICPB 4128) GN=Psta_2015 PE=4 SV=1: DUF1501 [Tuwongella immobilis]VTR98299.1 protein containing duf1501 : Uncharacterized protein OS=Pirellula staleyi (strain ATCC 27377 / DSM 6068 / ICPB 4128) GN=Psta_2015 PE=4 SV=1: DUF1501 [Tuwongella immobilis]
MFTLDLGRSANYCDGVNRRDFLTLGVAGMASLGLPNLLRAKDASTAATGTRKNTSVILLWLDGGPGHMDTYDMKPDAPAEYRGIWKPIRSKVPGFDVTELFPLQARITDHFSMVRSLYHNTGDHFAGAHRMLTTKDMGVSGANTAIKFPGIGSIVQRELGPRQPGMPGYVAVPYAMSVGVRPGYFGAHMVGAAYNPFETNGDPNATNFQVQNLNLANGLKLDHLNDRRSLVKHFDQARRDLDQRPEARTMDRFSQEAFDFVSSGVAKKAFDLSAEDPRIRDRYGRHQWGQSTLLARRLVEAGATFVTAHFGGWDHHWDLKKGMEDYLPKIDRLVWALFTDLAERGLLESTLVVLCGEFSRTPRMNDGGNGGAPMSMGTPGRDHWGNSMFCLMGGGGVKGGIVVGSTDRLGESPKSRPVTPSNIHATIYDVLGIDPKLNLFDPTGRPVPVLDDPTPISELL